MRTEEEDGAVSNTSPADSQVSSMEDVFAGRSNNRLHPFRIIEHDTLSIQSITSLGRVGRILSGTSDSNGIKDILFFFFHFYTRLVENKIKIGTRTVFVRAV